jgi:SAM-dependent methyltransferase
VIDPSAENSTRHQHSGGENLEVMRDAHNYNRYLVNLIRDHAGAAQSALDFGAGIGTFSGSLDIPRENVTCVEPDQAARDHLAREGFRSAESLGEVPAASIDYVFTLNVLEHIEDDAAALDELHRVLKTGGGLLIYVPAFMLLYTSMDAHVGHQRRYRMKPLLDLVQRAGFQIEKKAYTDALGYFATLVYKIFDSDTPKPLNPRTVRFYDRFLYEFVSLVQPILRSVDLLLAAQSQLM